MWKSGNFKIGPAPQLLTIILVIVKVKVLIGHYKMYNEICPVYLTHSSKPLGQSIRISGRHRTAPGNPSPDVESG